MMRTIAFVLTAAAATLGTWFLVSRPAAHPQNAISNTPRLPPLIAAAAAGQPETVRRLLDEGADVSVTSPAPHDGTALEAAIYHRENDIERITAVPNDVGGEGIRSQPLDGDGMVKDEDYREVVGMLRQAAKDKAKKGKHKKRRT